MEDLDHLKNRVETKIFRLNLTNGRGERIGPSTGYIDWLALSLFRHWIEEHTAPVKVGILKDSARAPRPQPTTSGRAVEAYQMLAAGGQAYLSHDECKRFLKLRPSEYSRDNMRRYERRIDELKNLATEAVRPLARCSLQTEDGTNFDYLTCLRVDERDFHYLWEEDA